MDEIKAKELDQAEQEQESYWDKVYKDLVERYGKEVVDAEGPITIEMPCPDKGIDFEKLRIVEEDIARNKLAKEQKALEEKQGS